MKKIKISVSIISLILIYSIIKIGTISAQIPQNIYISEGQKFVLPNSGIFSGLFSLSSPADHSGIVSSDGKVSSTKDSYSAEVKILDLVTVKKVNVTVAEQEKLIPCGIPVGIKIFSDGLEVIKAEAFVSGGKSVNPALKANIQKGDVITMANDIPVKKIQDFTKVVNTIGEQELSLTIEGESGTYKAKITPRMDDETNKYKVGLVVRDSMAGVGTLTYYNPSDNTFGALGHGIEDVETGVTFPAKSGSVENVHILSVVKGKKGMPGEIHGMFYKSSLNGSIVKNGNSGIFGKADLCPDGVISQPIPIGYCSDVKEGDAKIICTIEDNNTKEYSVNIEKILSHNTKNSKSMVIKITDRELLNKTGGIIQGMSGSPIIQDGKLIGAVTHVFVNDPTRGYGIFIENMLAEAEKIK